MKDKFQDSASYATRRSQGTGPWFHSSYFDARLLASLASLASFALRCSALRCLFLLSFSAKYYAHDCIAPCFIVQACGAACLPQ
jgi:hypothetical protein